MRGLISIIRRVNRENWSSVFSRQLQKKFDVIVFVRRTDTIIMSKRKVRKWAKLIQILASLLLW